MEIVWVSVVQVRACVYEGSVGKPVWMRVVQVGAVWVRLM